MFSRFLNSSKSNTQSITPYRTSTINKEMSLITQKENSVNTVVSSLSAYLENINGIILSFNSISENLMNFFNENSIYFQPFLIFSDQLRAISMNLNDHFEDFRGIDEKISLLKLKFENLKFLKKNYDKDELKFQHYKVKIEKLVNEKNKMERKGKSLTSKKINKILRNQTKLAKAKNDTLTSLKKFSNSAEDIHSETLDVICPILAGLSSSLESLHKKNSDFYLTLGQIVNSFQKTEDPTSYNIELYKDIIFHDEEFEGDKIRLCKENNTSFMNFYKKKKECSNVEKKIKDIEHSKNTEGKYKKKIVDRGNYESPRLICKLPEVPDISPIENSFDADIEFSSPSIRKNQILTHKKFFFENSSRKLKKRGDIKIGSFETESRASNKNETENPGKENISPVRKITQKDSLISNKDEFADIFFASSKKEELSVKKPLKMRIQRSSNLKKSDMLSSSDEEEKIQEIEEGKENITESFKESFNFDTEERIREPLSEYKAAQRRTNHGSVRTATFRNKVNSESNVQNLSSSDALKSQRNNNFLSVHDSSSFNAFSFGGNELKNFKKF